MKKTVLLILLFLIGITVLSADEYYFSGGIRSYNHGGDGHAFSFGYKNEHLDISLKENRGELISLSSGYSADLSSSFHWKTSFVFNFVTKGAVSFLVDGTISYEYGTESVFLDIGLGVQAGTVKYRELKNLLFSLSPLFNLSLNLKAGLNSFSMGLLMDHLWERQIKAVPTYFFNMRRDFTPDFTLSFDFWGKGAEYLMDPWINFQNYGVLVTLILKDGK